MSEGYEVPTELPGSTGYKERVIIVLIVVVAKLLERTKIHKRYEKCFRPPQPDKDKRASSPQSHARLEKHFNVTTETWAMLSV